MKPKLTSPLLEQSTPELRTPFHVVVAYDDVPMGVRAKHVLDSIGRTLAPDCHLVVNIWKFSMLRLAELAESAVREAVAADMIILALREDNGVPHETKTWIEAWLQRRVNAAGALVLLFDPDNQPSVSARSAHAYLHGVGKRSHLDVFALSDEADWANLQWLCLECGRLGATATPKRTSRELAASEPMNQDDEHRLPFGVNGVRLEAVHATRAR